MKKNFIIAGLLIAGLYNAQQDGSVGINTKTPSGATLDVQIDKSTGHDKTVGQGVAVPRVTKQELFEMTKTIAEGALVYVNDIGATSGTGNADRVAEVTTANGVGFYYYQYTDKAGNGLWKKVGGGASSSTTKEFIGRLNETTGPSYEWTAGGSMADYYNFETNGGAIKLPDPTKYKGVTIHIKNSTGGLINYTGTNGIDYPWKTSGISASAAQIIWSNGEKWYLIGGRN